MTELLRWDVLNSCLRHGRFAIDSPTLGITNNKPSHFEQGNASGIRESLLLHPSLVDSCNTTFSPCLDKVERIHPDVDRWVKSSTTGYQCGSGADFVGPPHLKQMDWTSNNSSKICSKPTFLNKVDHLVSGLKKSSVFLEVQSQLWIPFYPFSPSGMRPTLCIIV